MGQIVAHRFGQDAPNRILASTPVLMEATEVIPAQVAMPGMVPFLPPTTGGGSSTDSGFVINSNGDRVWTRFPSRIDLEYYQGDDVVIPFYIQDPNNPELDMSDQDDWVWEAQVRQRHNYQSALVYEFSIDSVWTPPAGEGEMGTTLINMLLPRELNTVTGCFAWELFSTSPVSYSTEFPRPDGWLGEWPPETAVRTWLYGLVTVLRRGSTTDILNDGSTSPPSGGGPAVTTGGFVVGPNGRVP